MQSHRRGLIIVFLLTTPIALTVGYLLYQNEEKKEASTEAIENGRFSLEKTLKDPLAQHGLKPAMLLNLSHMELSSGNPAQAISDSERALSMTKELELKAPLYLTLAKAYAMQKKWDEAENALKEAEAYSPLSSSIEKERIKIEQLHLKELIDTATLESYQKALSLGVKDLDLDAWLHLQIALQLKNESAASHFENAIDIPTKNGELKGSIHYNYGAYLLSKEKTEDAHTQFQEALVFLSPKSDLFAKAERAEMESSQNLFSTYYAKALKTEDTDKSFTFFKKASTFSSPSEMTTYNFLRDIGLTEKKLGFFKESALHLQAAISLGLEKDALQNLLIESAESSLKAADYESALKNFARAEAFENKDLLPRIQKGIMESYTGASISLINQAKRALKNKSPKQALEYLEKAEPLPIENKELTCEIALNKGLAYSKIGVSEQALTFFKKSIEIQENAPAYIAMGQEVENIDPKEALSYYKKALTLDPMQAKAHYLIGRFCLAEGKNKEAISHFEKVVQQGHGQILALGHLTLGRLYQRLGNKEKAFSHFESASSTSEIKSSLTAAILNEKADNLRLFGNIESALSVYKQGLAISEMEDATKAHLLYGLGRTHFQKNEVADSIHDFQEALSIEGVSSQLRAEICRSLAKALQANGKRDDSLKIYEKALSLAPENKALAKEHEEALRVKTVAP